MRIIFLGPPGVGKGSQAKLLADRCSYIKISTGDILREAVSLKTPLGLKAKDCMDRGELVPDEVMIDVICERISRPDCRSAYILDGFPRTLAQAQALSEFQEKQSAPLHYAICLDVPEEEIARRLAGRRHCPGCQRVYQIESYPPKKENFCDSCETMLIQRKDDQYETMLRRLRVYQRDTSPLMDYYSNQGILKIVDGSGEVEEVQKRLVGQLEVDGSVLEK